MANIAQSLSLAVSPQMYRHFAVITVVITALIAIFADGERRDAVEDHLADRKAKAAAYKAEQEKQAKQGLKTKIKDKRRSTTWRQGGRAGGNFGQGEIQEAVYEPGARRPPMARPPAAMSPEAQMYGSSVDSLPEVPPPGMSPEVYERLRKLKEMRKLKRGPDSANQSQLRQISEISAQRAGVEDVSSD